MSTSGPTMQTLAGRLPTLEPPTRLRPERKILLSREYRGVCRCSSTTCNSPRSTRHGFAHLGSLKEDYLYSFGKLISSFSLESVRGSIQ